MDLRRRTTQALAGAGALLVVAGLSLGAGVALAVPGPTAQAPLDGAKVSTASSDHKSDHKSGNKKNRSSKSRRSKTDNTDSTGPTDSSGTDPTGSGSTGSGSTGTDSTETTATTATTTPTRTAPTPTTATTMTPSTTRPTPTTGPPTTPSTSAATDTSSDPSTGSDSAGSDGSSNGMSGTYNGGSYQGTQVDDDSATTTTEPSRTPGPKPSANRPSARSGAGLPPGVYPVSPDQRPENETPAATSFKAPAGGPPAPSTPAETQPSPATTPSTAAAAAATPQPAPEISPGSDIGGAEPTPAKNPAPRRGRQLGQTGDGTRRLILFGGVAMLLGAVVVAFAGRDGSTLAAAAALPVGPGRRRPPPRKEIDGWEDSIPLAPVKRDLARNRLGISAGWCSDDELGV